MIIRTYDATILNAFLKRDGEDGDLSDILAEPLHVALVEDENAAIFAWRGPGIYELHLMFAARGREAMSLLSRMIEAMRADFGARFFWALIPVDRRKVRLFARWMGWSSHGLLLTRGGEHELFVSENGYARIDVGQSYRGSIGRLGHEKGSGRSDERALGQPAHAARGVLRRGQSLFRPGTLSERSTEAA